MTVSVAVMAHPKRKGFVDELVPSLGAEPEVVWDRRNDRWDTGRRSLLAFDQSASHHMVVQDDAVVSRDLVQGIERAVQHTGEHPVALYIGRSRPYKLQVERAHTAAAESGATWLEMPGPWWGVAVVVPTAHIPEMVKWADERNDIDNYDKRIARWYGHRDINCWYSMPSLVDHRPVAENPSLVQGRTGNRRAHYFIGKDVSALSIEWASDAYKADYSALTPQEQKARKRAEARVLRRQAVDRRIARREARKPTTTS